MIGISIKGMDNILSLVFMAIAALLIGIAHVFSAIKSGCFYSVSRQADPHSPLLSKYIKNLHYAQTPFWYCLFGAFFFALMAVFIQLNPESWFYNILCAYLITQGTSAIFSPFYQGFINVGAGNPFIDKNENKRMELANPLNNKTHWIKRFWHGENRIIAMIGGVAMVALGFEIIILRMKL